MSRSLSSRRLTISTQHPSGPNSREDEISLASPSHGRAQKSEPRSIPERQPAQQLVATAGGGIGITVSRPLSVKTMAEAWQDGTSDQDRDHSFTRLDRTMKPGFVESCCEYEVIL